MERGREKKLAVKIFPKENAQDREMRMAKGLVYLSDREH